MPQVTKKNHLVGGYEGFRFYDLAKTGDAGKKGEEDDEDGGWNEGFAIAPEWGTNCFPKGSEDGYIANRDLHPFDPVAFESTCKAYFHAVQELGRHVLGMIAEGLGLERDFFKGYLENQNSFCRLTHYYREDEEGNQGKGVHNHSPGKVEIGAAPHTGELIVCRAS
jgi:isopenicillin N synthase-like dioxygenase